MVEFLSSSHPNNKRDNFQQSWNPETPQQSWERAVPCMSSASEGRLRATKWAKCLLDHKTNSCCRVEWYEQKNEAVWWASSSARAHATLPFSCQVLRWEHTRDLSMVSPETINELQGQCCSHIKKNISHQLWECLVEYKNILLSCSHTGLIIIIMGNGIAVDPALCLKVRIKALMFLDKDRIWFLFPEWLIIPLYWATITFIFKYYISSPKHCPWSCLFPCENYLQLQITNRAPKFPTLIAIVLWKEVLPQQMWKRSRQSWKAKETYLIKRETSLVISCLWSLCQIQEQCLIWPLMLIALAFPAFFWHLSLSHLL